ncbi:MAG: SDR family oxidoreductase [Rhodospirillaceae bacterium]|nr:SDR family oxidoreductase [Rhodospirillaceae bacterium]
MTAQDKVVVISGAGSGIGRSVALALLQRGYKLVLTGRRAAALEETVALSKASAKQTHIVAADVGKPADVTRVFESAVKTFGRVDVLFNNAGIFPAKTLFEDITPEQWNEVVAVNFTGAFLMAQGAFRVMKDQKPQGGRIINNGSISAAVPRPNSAPYTSTKHAITGLTKSISLDGRKYNIACGQIDIGNAATALTGQMQTGIAQANGTTMVEPTMDVSDVGEAVAYMAGLPLSANVQFMTVMATAMPFIGRG